MLDTILLVFPLVMFFMIGYFFKTYFCYSEDMGQILTRIVLYITLPATIFLSVSGTKNISQAAFLPLSALVIQLSMFAVFFHIAKKLVLEKDTEVVFITTPLISNTLLFLAPLFYLIYGDEGVTRVVLYDLGNAMVIYLVAQAVFKFKTGGLSVFSCIKTMMSSVPIWAFILGLIAGGLDLVIPQSVLKPLSIMREVNVFLPLFLLGFYFVPALDKAKLVIGTVSLRMVMGLTLGVGASFLFANPMDKITVIMATAAPIGLMSLIFASEYDRDIRFSSSVVSYSTILSLIVVTILDYIFVLVGLK